LIFEKEFIMAHMIATTASGKNAMAYVGDTPWHGLGQRLSEDSPIEVWAAESGLDFKLATADVQYKTSATDTLNVFEGKKVMYRQDTGASLGIVSNRYKIVQPIEVLEFFREMVGTIAHLETAGVLRGGAHYWALARMNGEFSLGSDKVNQYLLLASSADGSLTTQARLTAVRVVCNNTMQMAQQGKADVVVKHTSVFDPKDAQRKLADCNDTFKAFAETAQVLSNIKISSQQAQTVFTKLLGGDADKPSRAAVRALALFQGCGIGAELESSKETAWGALNAVTQLLDWETARTTDSRLCNAWFGGGVSLKQQAVTELLAMA
jgi:phage/plasmid-like protein (TIGR03299 family)